MELSRQKVRRTQLEVISFYDSDRQEHWLEEIKRSDWGGGISLYNRILNDTLIDKIGEGSRVLLLVDGDELISFCTYAKLDNIQPTDLTPWMGYVYTFPEHRGHHYLNYLFEEIERLAKQDGVAQIYISTDHTGLYEKYGCEYLTEMKDVHGEPARVYVKRFE